MPRAENVGGLGFMFEQYTIGRLLHIYCSAAATVTLTFYELGLLTFLQYSTIIYMQLSLFMHAFFMLACDIL